MAETVDRGRTYNSNELRGSILTPRKVESESQEDRSLSVITAKLIKSSARTGCDVGENALEVEVDDKHNN